MAQEASQPETSNIEALAKYQLSTEQLHTLRKDLIREMNLGLENRELNKEHKNPSTVTMLSSHVKSLPTGKEHATFYTIDWGGTNFRALRLELCGRKDGYRSKQTKFQIEDKYRKAESEIVLFDHLASSLKEFMIEEKEEHGTCDPNLFFPIGFCFSFPMYQPSLSEGILVTWTKGFTVPDVVGHDVGTLMNQAFERKNMKNVKVDSIVNDTVGTLLACAYEHENTRVGLILGTGSNCAYYDPNLGEVVNCEWGNFGSTNKYKDESITGKDRYPLPRVSIDEQLDASTANKGEYYAEKMMSGRYLGELVRLAAIEVFGTKITKYGDKSLINTPWALGTMYTSIMLANENKGDFDKVTSYLNNDCGLTEFTDDDCKLFCRICEAITHRSADIAATMLTGVLQKTGLFEDNDANNSSEEKNNNNNNNGLVMNDKYSSDNEYVTVGIDGSVYNKDEIFRLRMHSTLQNILGEQIYSKIRMTKSDDGSGKGAALAACCHLGTPYQSRKEE